MSSHYGYIGPFVSVKVNLDITEHFMIKMLLIVYSSRAEKWNFQFRLIVHPSHERNNTYKFVRDEWSRLRKTSSKNAHM